MDPTNSPARTARRLITRAGDLKHRRMHELLDELGLHSGQAFVLRALWKEDGLTHSDLAERLHRSPSAITKTVQRLEKAGFAGRRPDGHDERVSRVYLTEAGCEIRPAAEAVWNQLDQQLFAGFNPEELASFANFLTRVCDNITNQARQRGEK